MPRPLSLPIYGLLAWQIYTEAGRYGDTGSFVADGPAWRSEVAAWQADPSHVLRL